MSWLIETVSNLAGVLYPPWQTNSDEQEQERLWRTGDAYFAARLQQDEVRDARLGLDGSPAQRLVEDRLMHPGRVWDDLNDGRLEDAEEASSVRASREEASGNPEETHHGALQPEPTQALANDDQEEDSDQDQYEYQGQNDYHGNPYECLGCGETELTNYLTAPCQHSFCFPCLARFFAVDLGREVLYPPTCCREDFHIEDEDLALFLDPVTLAEYRRRAVFERIPLGEGTDCHNLECNAFIPRPARSGDGNNDDGTNENGENDYDIADCTACGARTCTKCETVAHPGDECPPDAPHLQLLRLAAESGWQRCRQCRAFVEREDGCAHMDCLCGAQFCYTCGAAWRTCDCDIEAQNILIEHATLVGQPD